MNTGTQIGGTWNVTAGTPRGERPGTLRLVSDGTAVTGTMNGTAIKDGARQDGTLTFAARLAGPFNVTARCTVRVAGDTMNGEARVAGLPLAFPVSGTRGAA